MSVGYILKHFQPYNNNIHVNRKHTEILSILCFLPRCTCSFSSLKVLVHMHSLTSTAANVEDGILSNSSWELTLLLIRSMTLALTSWVLGHSINTAISSPLLGSMRVVCFLTLSWTLETTVWRSLHFSSENPPLALLMVPIPAYVHYRRRHGARNGIVEQCVLF